MQNYQHVHKYPCLLGTINLDDRFISDSLAIPENRLFLRVMEYDFPQLIMNIYTNMKRFYIFFALVLSLSLSGYAQTISVDTAKQHQTIQGFGFFGAHDVWWHSPSLMWNREWAEMVVSDLGLTMWRNEIHPPATPQRKQDADWNKQLPMVEGLKSVADEYGVDIKVLLTVWSPPASMKWGASFSWAGDQKAERFPDPNIQTNHGGTLNPNMYEDYANYLIDHIKEYEKIGVKVYGLSLQNEPYFSQDFNSCTYTVYWYCELLNGVVPVIKKAYPDIKIFGSENMLAMEGLGKNWEWFFHNAIKNDKNAPSNIDALAVHGYSDGVIPSTGSALAEMWTNHTEKFSKPLNKPAWMTETSGYVDSWEPVNNRTGALGLALDIHAALYYGNIEAWVWWQGSENPGSTSIGDYSLMAGTTVGKKYYASRHFYRFIRPGAVRVEATAPYSDVFVTAYHHPERSSHTLVVINSAKQEREINVEGANVPATFQIYRSSASEDCEHVGEYLSGTNLTLPPRSVVTLASDDKLVGVVDLKESRRNLSSDQVYVFPNPYKSGDLTVKLEGVRNSEVHVSFFAVAGALVQKNKVYAVNGMLNLQPSLRKGTYLMQLEVEGEKVSKLISVQ